MEDETMKIWANGIEMNYESSGEGECLVLIHGFSDNMNMWYNQTPEFSKQYRVLTYDVRGFGETEGNGDSYSMELFADDLYELLTALDIRSACVLGYSMGGRIALEFAVRHPEFMAGLVFANSGMGDAPSPDMEERRKMMVSVLEQGNIEVISEIMTVASFSPGFEEKNPAAFRRYKDIKMQNNPSAYPAIAQMMIEALSVTPDWSRLRCPVLIIAGERDGLMEMSVAESMKTSISNAILKTLPTGHAAAIEAPEQFNQVVLEFVRGLQGH
jgi:pimeloyl-ACP methyl ester carboxylesterase